MATNLGTLTLNLLANTGSYTQGLQRAERQTEESTENMAEGYDLVGKSIAALSGIVAGISVASVAALALEAINAGNQVKKLADLSNADTQQFQYYAVGAKTAGIEIEQFADQMKDMQDRIGDFQQTGGGPLADFFTNIAPLVGVTIEQFQKLSGPDAIQLFYSSLQKVFATENDIKFYMEAIISDSSKLIPLLRDGGKGFQEWGDRAKEAGAIMSDSMIQQMDEAKKNLQVFDLQWQGLKTTLINDAMPALSSVINNMDAVTNVLTVSGAFIVGAYIPAIYGVTTALVQKINTHFADVRATQLANEITLQRTARLVHLTEVELNNARVQAARMTGMARLAFVERTLIPLEQQHTAAVAANTVAQNANNASKSIAITVGRGLMAVLGGPVGLGLLVAGAAASYLLLRDNTDKATKSLNEDGIAVADVVTKYQQLTEAQQRNQLRAETDSLVDLTSKYKDAKDELVSLTLNLYRSGDASSDVAKNLSQLGLEYKNGQLNAEMLAAKINSLNGVSAEGRAKIDAQVSSVKLANDAMIEQKNITQAMIQANIKLADSHGKVADGVSKQALEMYKLTSEQRAYVNQVQSDALRDKFIQDQVAKGVPRSRAEFKADAYSGAKVDLAKPNEVPRLVDEAEQQAWAIDQANKMREDAEKRAEEAAKKRESDRKKAANEADNLRKKQFQYREDIYYQYASREMKIEKDLQNELRKIREAGFTDPKMQAGYITNAENRANLEKQLYTAQLAAELNEWQDTEQEKLNRKVKINELMINLDSDMNNEFKQQALDSLIDRSNQELAWIELEQALRISDAGEMLRTDLQNMEIKYAFERKKIEENAQLSDDERQKRLALSFASEEFQKRQNLNSATAAWGGTYADLTGTGAQYQMEQDRFNKYDESQALFDAQMALANSAVEREAIWQAHNERMLQIDKQYDLESRNLSLSQYSDALGAATGFFGEMLGRSSGTYKALYFAQKSFALAQAGMNVYKSASDAYANEPGTVWQKIGAAALATVKSSSFVSLIQAATPQGFATGGHIVGEGTGTSDDIPIWASNGEFMIRAAAVQRLGLENLNYMNKTGQLPSKFATGGLIGREKFLNTNLSNGVESSAGQGKVIINNYGSDSVETSNNVDGDLIVTIGKMVDQRIDAGVDRGIARNLKQGHLLSKAIKGN